MSDLMSTMGTPDQMAFRMRSSKYRHVYGAPVKKEQCYECIKITKNAHDSNFCAVNPKFIAIVTESAGGGAFLVLPLDRTGRVDVNASKVCGHAGPVLDVKWNPFDDQVIASSSDDTTVKLWTIPEGGLKTNLTEWLVDLHGHTRRVGYIEWHPTAAGILLSAGYDFKCILWNTETAEPINIICVHQDTIFSIAWSRDGSLFATTCKDKKLRVIDPREGSVIAEGQSHVGSKASKVVFLGSNNRLFTTGFSRLSERQYGIWDIKNLSKPLKMETVDSSSGVLIPFFDVDTGVVFVAGKGDGNIRYYEIVTEQPYCHYLNQYQSGSPQRGLGIMPKRGIDPSRCEIVRFFKLHTVKNLVEPVSMIVPRKSEMFQEDIFPPTASGAPSLTSDEWISGQNRDPILISLKDGAISHSPTITTYRAVKRGASSTDSGSHKRNAAFTSPTSAATEKVPASVKNIEKLSVKTDITDLNPAEETKTAPAPTPSSTSSSKPASNDAHDQNLNIQTRMTNSNEPMRVDKKVWSANYTAVTDEVPAVNGIPKTDPEKVHVKKVWSALPQPTVTPTVPMHNGMPTTDAELRKAYFRQLEEIHSLKEQIALKDKRIRQLEAEVQIIKCEQTGASESNC